MKLLGLYIESYGILRDFSLTEEDLASGPCIIYGLNEAGKSTLLSFIRAVLFGFKPEGERAEPVGGGRCGGCLVVEDDGEKYRVERYRKGRGKAVVELPDGGRAGEELLKARILRGVSPVLFRNVFALGVDELRRLEDLEKDEFSAYIYGAGTGTSPQRLAEATARLEKTALNLFNPRGRAPLLNKTIAELEALDRKIRELEQQPGRYFALRAKTAELEHRRIQLKEMKRQREERRRSLEKLFQARGPWLELQDCLAGLRDRERVRFFPEDGVERLKELEVRRDQKQEELLALSLTIEALQNKLDAVRPDEAVLVEAPAIEELERERSAYLKEKRELAEFQARVNEAEKTARDRLVNLGPGWDEAGVLGLDTSLAARRQVDRFAEYFRDHRQKRVQAVGSLESSERDFRRLSKEKDELAKQLAALSRLSSNALPPCEGLEMLERAARILDRLEHIRELQRLNNKKLQETEERMGHVEAGSADEGAGKRLRSLLPALLLACLGVGVMFYDFPLGLLLGAGFTMAAVLYAVLSSRAGERRRHKEELRRELELLLKNRTGDEQERERLNQELENAAGELRRDALALAGRDNIDRDQIPSLRSQLLAALESLRRRDDLQARLAAEEKALARAEGDLLLVRREMESVDEALSRLQKEWTSWLREKDLPTLEPDGVADFLDLAERAVDDIRRLQCDRQALGRAEAALRSYESRVNELAGFLGRGSVSGGEAADYVAGLYQNLREQQEAAALRLRYVEELEKAQADKEIAGENLAVVEEKLKELLALGDAADAENFRRRAAAYREQRDLERRVVELRRQLLNIADSDEKLAVLEKELHAAAGQNHEEEYRQLKEQKALDEDEMERLGNEIAAAAQEMRILEAEEELARARQQREMLRQSLAIGAREWQVNVLCAALLELAREKHERERQPAVLALASRLIGPMTAERYTRVLAPVGAAASLEVEEPGGRRVNAPLLSRGAAGQLYLSVRLALASHFSTTVTPMPIILDDILVDSDARRLKGTLRVLEQVAREHQVIMITCHQHILEAARKTLSKLSSIRVENGTRK